MAFRQYPLVRFGKDQVLCIDLGFLVDKLSSGIYWTLHGFLSRDSSERAAGFMTHRGKLFQRYVDDLLRDTYPRHPDILTPIHYSSPPDFEDSDYGDGIIYSENSDGFWVKREFDGSRMVYCEYSTGEEFDRR